MTMADILSAVNDARTLLANDELDGAERILAMLAGDLEYMEWQRVRRGPMLDMPLIWPARRDRMSCRVARPGYRLGWRSVAVNF
jgi:hypothetical protein